jgi:hypothetical protein
MEEVSHSSTYFSTPHQQSHFSNSKIPNSKKGLHHTLSAGEEQEYFKKWFPYYSDNLKEQITIPYLLQLEAQGHI